MRIQIVINLYNGSNIKADVSDEIEAEDEMLDKGYNQLVAQVMDQLIKGAIAVEVDAEAQIFKSNDIFKIHVKRITGESGNQEA